MSMRRASTPAAKYFPSGLKARDRAGFGVLRTVIGLLDFRSQTVIREAMTPPEATYWLSGLIAKSVTK
jgi:hypothetical protein